MTKCVTQLSLLPFKSVPPVIEKWDLSVKARSERANVTSGPGIGLHKACDLLLGSAGLNTSLDFYSSRNTLILCCS
jgi:hypothetical protein